MSMDITRRNAIAYEYLKLVLKSAKHGNGVDIGNNFRRTVGHEGKQLDVPFGEMLEFKLGVAAEMLAEVSDAKRPPTDDEREGMFGAH